MKRIKTKVIIGVAFIVFGLSSASAGAFTDYTEEANYVYNQEGESVNIPTAYEYKTAISLNGLKDLTVTSPVDMFVKDSGEVFVVDSKLNAILFFDTNLKLTKILEEFKTSDGSVVTLNNPQGIFASSDGRLYIADTGNGRVLVSDTNGFISLIIEKPENLLGTDLSSFLPVKVVADSAGRISVVARNLNSGILQFSKEGTFIGYSGAPNVSVDAFTKILKKFSTDAQKAQMQTFVPTEYNNIKMDSKNFIWGTISSISTDSLMNVIQNKDVSGKITPVKKLNTMGADVLRRKGVFPPVGELSFYDTPSKIIDTGLGPNRIYSLLDSYYGRIFTYNNDGILLYAFGNKGTKKGNMQNPVAIDYVKDDIYVLDAGLCQLIIYEPTAYGKLLIDAEGYFNEGEYDKANKKWEEVAERNSNFEYAYIGLGNAKFGSAEYKEAMEYYEYAGDQVNYSKAKERLRKQTSETIFPVLFISLLSLCGLSIVMTVVLKIRRYARGEEGDRQKAGR
jgi:hypothetical protein